MGKSFFDMSSVILELTYFNDINYDEHIGTTVTNCIKTARNATIYTVYTIYTV